jgi:hypothetical protein
VNKRGHTLKNYTITINTGSEKILFSKTFWYSFRLFYSGMSSLDTFILSSDRTLSPGIGQHTIYMPGVCYWIPKDCKFPFKIKVSYWDKYKDVIFEVLSVTPDQIILRYQE